MGAKLLQDVRQDLADVVQVCEGKKKQTNYLRTLINELVKGAEIRGVGQLGAEALAIVCATLRPVPTHLQAHCRPQATRVSFRIPQEREGLGNAPEFP